MTALLSMKYSHAEPSLIDMVVNLLERSDDSAQAGHLLGNTPRPLPLPAVNHSKPEASHISDAGIRDSINTSQHFSFEDLLATSPI
jgi:hypothetical protein